MSYLIDTNILLRSADPNHPMYPDATDALKLLRKRKKTLYITPQNLIEFWNVYTRPKERNGLGGSIIEVQIEINRINVIFSQVLKEAEGQSGGIEISTGSLFLSDGATVSASTLGKGDAGAIKITAIGSISLTGESSQGYVSGVGSEIFSTAKVNSGGIEIITGSLFLNNGAAVSASTFGSGNAGVIKITARDIIYLAGESSKDVSRIVSQVESTAEGNSGGIEISTGSLSLTDGAQISANTFNKGNAGAIKITARDSISLTGENSQGRSGIFSQIAQSTAEGKSGGIEMITGSLSLTDGTAVSANTEGIGNAGAIKITASDSISLSGENSKGFGSFISSQVFEEAKGVLRRY